MLSSVHLRDTGAHGVGSARCGVDSSQGHVRSLWDGETLAVGHLVLRSPVALPRRLLFGGQLRRYLRCNRHRFYLRAARLLVRLWQSA